MGFLSALASGASTAAKAASSAASTAFSKGGVGWELLPMAASMGADMYSQSQMAGKVEDAGAAQANIEAQNRAYQQKLFEEDIKRSKPFYEAGIKALPEYEKAVTNDLDPTKSGLYKMQSDLMAGDLEDAPEYVKEDAFKRLGAEEQQKAKPRLLDLMQIGMGAAGSAGRTSVNLGTALARSYGTASQTLQKTGQEAKDIRQSMWGRAADEISGLPAYFASKPSGNKTTATPYDRSSTPGGRGGY
jgi:hypothetical protein